MNVYCPECYTMNDAIDMPTLVEDNDNRRRQMCLGCGCVFSTSVIGIREPMTAKEIFGRAGMSSFPIPVPRRMRNQKGTTQHGKEQAEEQQGNEGRSKGSGEGEGGEGKAGARSPGIRRAWKESQVPEAREIEESGNCDICGRYHPLGGHFTHFTTH